jgi:hypothetical protein
MADFDWALLSLAVGLAAFGVLEIWSVTTTHGMAPGLWRMQFVVSLLWGGVPLRNKRTSAEKSSQSKADCGNGRSK